MRNLFQRVIVIPAKLETAIYLAVAYVATQIVALILQLSGLDLTEPIMAIGAAVALAITIGLRLLLEKLPEALHPVVNVILVYIAGFFGVLALLRFLA